MLPVKNFTHVEVSAAEKFMARERKVIDLVKLFNVAEVIDANLAAAYFVLCDKVDPDMRYNSVPDSELKKLGFTSRGIKNFRQTEDAFI